MEIGRSWLKESLGKKFTTLHLNREELVVMGCTCHPSQAGSMNRWIMVQAGAGINVRPSLKNN
jgi:hypothetical protein